MRKPPPNAVALLRSLGFRGSGQNFRKIQEMFAFVVNFQGSTSGDRFYVNIGAQPLFIPSEGAGPSFRPGDTAAAKKLKEYECIFRGRVGEWWPWDISAREAASLEEELREAIGVFSDIARRFPPAVANQSAETLIEKFTIGTTTARSALHLSRAALSLGHAQQARFLAERGLGLAGEQATILRRELQDVLSKIQV
jgi:hypothetical protein